MRLEVSSNIKQTYRTIGIDDGPFPPKTDYRIRYAPLLAVWLKGSRLQKVKAEWIIVDGLDATQKAERILKGSKGTPVLLSGVSFGGFNLIDARKIQRLCKAPVIIVTGSRPDNRAVKRALSRHFPDWKLRWDLIRSLGPLHRVRTRLTDPPVFFENFGCSSRDAVTILKRAFFISRMPEALRVANILAKGLFPLEPLS